MFSQPYQKERNQRILNLDSLRPLPTAGLTSTEGLDVHNQTTLVTHCNGSNIRLNEADPKVTPSEVYVFRGGEALASTTVNASGTLTVTDGHVMMTD